MTNKNNDMKNVLRIASVMLFISVLSACGTGSKEKKGDLTDKKVKLEKLKSDREKLNGQITSLEAEIATLDPNAHTGVAKLVVAAPLAKQDFTHYIELQGKIDAENISYVSPRGAPGLVKELYIKQGDYVKKGQLLLKLDDAVQVKQIEGLKIQLGYAQDIARRQKNLWDQGIGTEVQLLTAQNNVKNLQSQINSAEEGLEMTKVYSDVNGYVEQLLLRKGETFTGAVGNNPQIGIVDKSILKATANIPENYIARVKNGTAVQIVVPDLGNKMINSTVSRISQLIDPNTRGFVVEANIHGDQSLKPNQTAIMKILDYSSKNTIVVPINTIQSDEKGRFVYVMEKKGEKMIATKKPVIVGETTSQTAEIKSGLNDGDQLITDGYQNLYEGQVVAVAK